MLSGLDHLVVTVTDIPRAVDFYTRVLGLETRYRDAERVDLMLGDVALRLHLDDNSVSPRAATPSAGSLDLCFRSARPLDEIQQHLEALSVPIDLGPVPRDGAQGPIESLYLRDPDGNLLEICRPARLTHSDAPSHDSTA
ncbi:glyoxalase/bleomycin resistance/extradiol dioxygenase family protein [Litchfieldella xinjiangensis]|uniref:glyoxalase/bleomycin resistance/extradiol dioxygenase family protein n=1 Tax=Litchfieldella xinjiangensis TaxID=1166948 RepID=UPI0006932466|nr:glyoxalase/bleomycin resistance/extradiol dioxygenase family protein [Halomonas xinjiangensis]